VVVIPFHLIDCKQMPFVGFLILSRVCQRTFVNFPFFSANKERKVVESVKVEA